MYISPYIGRTGLIDGVLRAKIPLITSGQLTDSLERRLLFTGPYGIGKTDLARALALLIAEHPLNVEFRMGTQVNVEVVRDWLRSAPYRPLFGGNFVKIIDEVDTVPTIAITELRQYLDDLPHGVVFFATSNKAPKELPEPLQTRFMENTSPSTTAKAPATKSIMGGPAREWLRRHCNPALFGSPLNPSGSSSLFHRR